MQSKLDPSGEILSNCRMAEPKVAETDFSA
jgi:hypothetical protein